MTTYKDSGKILQWANATGSAVVSGAVIVVGAILAIAQNAIANGVTGAVFVSGRFSVTKPNDEAWTAGQRIYWDSSAENFTSTVTAYFAGCASAAAAETATTGYILLNDGCPVLPVSATSAALTDSSGGTAATTIAAIGATYDQAEVANAIASLAAQTNALRADMVSAKLIRG